ncbi:MAG: hypothetical protein P1P64_04765 [Treponemataceae bacterium]
MAKIIPTNVPGTALAATSFSAEQIKEAFSELLEYKKEIKRLDVIRECVLEEIEQKYTLYHKIFDYVFADRRDANKKFFKVIDKGIKERDKDLISMGISGLATVVTSSPFNDIGELRKLIDSDKKIEL